MCTLKLASRSRFRAPIGLDKSRNVRGLFKSERKKNQNECCCHCIESNTHTHRYYHKLSHKSDGTGKLIDLKLDSYSQR
jgi:hypothetical protein